MTWVHNFCLKMPTSVINSSAKGKNTDIFSVVSSTWSEVCSVICYIALLLGGLVFVKASIGDYFKGDTSYTETKEPLTLNDLPTLTFCAVYRYSSTEQWLDEDYDVEYSGTVLVHGQDFNLITKVCIFLIFNGCLHQDTFQKFYGMATVKFKKF